MKEIKARFPDEFHAQCVEYCDYVGVSLNGFLAMAAREYLDRHTYMVVTAAAKKADAEARLQDAQARNARLQLLLATPASGPPSQVVPPDPYVPRAKSGSVDNFKAPRKRSDACPCGARGANGFRLTWAQCHGKGVK